MERIPGPEEEGLVALWEQEWKKDLFDRALEKVRAKVDEKQFQIFDLYALQQWSANKVARSLGVSRARVYVTKHRVSRLVRRQIERLQKS